MLTLSVAVASGLCIALACLVLSLRRRAMLAAAARPRRTKANFPPTGPRESACVGTEGSQICSLGPVAAQSSTAMKTSSECPSGATSPADPLSLNTSIPHEAASELKPVPASSCSSHDLGPGPSGGAGPETSDPSSELPPRPSPEVRRRLRAEWASPQELLVVLRRLGTEMDVETGRWEVADHLEDRLQAHRRLAGLLHRAQSVAERSGLLASERDLRRGPLYADQQDLREAVSDTVSGLTGKPLPSADDPINSFEGRSALISAAGLGPGQRVIREEAFVLRRPAQGEESRHSASQGLSTSATDARTQPKRALDPAAVQASRQRILDQGSSGTSSAASSRLPSPKADQPPPPQPQAAPRSILKKRNSFGTPQHSEEDKRVSLKEEVKLKKQSSSEEEDMERRSPFTNQPRSAIITDLAPAVGKGITTQVYRRTSPEGTRLEETVETQKVYASPGDFEPAAFRRPPSPPTPPESPESSPTPPPPVARPPSPPSLDTLPSRRLSNGHSKEQEAKMTKPLREIREPAPNPTFSRAKVAVAANGVETLEIEEHEAAREWDPVPLLNHLYRVDYSGHPVTKKSRFLNMEGHLEHLPIGLRGALSEAQWTQHYFKTKEGRLQWFSQAFADEYPFGEMDLSGAEVAVNREEGTLRVSGGRENVHLVLRCQPGLVDKWRNAIASHAASSHNDCYTRPLADALPHPRERVVLIELGSSAIRAGVLTDGPSLPQLYFPSLAAQLPDKEVVVGVNALWASTRKVATLLNPIRQPSPHTGNRYQMDVDILNHFFIKIFQDLEIVDPSQWKVLLSVPEDTPGRLVSELAKILLDSGMGVGVGSMGVARHPSLILYAYDVTTGVVVDMGHRLNIVPIIDGYVVESAIVSLPLGSAQLADALRLKLSDSNTGVYAFQSTAEQFVLRQVMEEACYVAQDYAAELAEAERTGALQTVSMAPYEPTAQMMREFKVDSAAFAAPEGLFDPALWGMDLKGIHKLIAAAIQASPMDSRRSLYRNIYMAGGCSLLPGLAERVETELTKLTAPTIHVQVRVSPWRLHAAYLGAQVLAQSRHFNNNLVDKDSLKDFTQQLLTKP